MTTVKQRPPATPLMEFHATGAYRQSLPKKVQADRNSMPDVAAKLSVRNLRGYDEVNVKSITNDPALASTYYVPNSYLKPEHITAKLPQPALSL